MSKANSLTSLAARLAANMNFAKMGATVGSTAAAKVDALTAGVGSINGIMVTLAAQDELVLSALAAADLPSAQASYVQPSGPIHCRCRQERHRSGVEPDGWRRRAGRSACGLDERIARSVAGRRLGATRGRRRKRRLATAGFTSRSSLRIPTTSSFRSSGTTRATSSTSGSATAQSSGAIRS